MTNKEAKHFAEEHDKRCKQCEVFQKHLDEMMKIIDDTEKHLKQERRKEKAAQIAHQK